MKLKIESPIKKVKKYFCSYLLGLILCKNKKNCTNMSKHLKVTHDMVYRFFSKVSPLQKTFPSIMISISNHFSRIKSGWLIIDDTALNKSYSAELEGLEWIYDTCSSNYIKGFSVIVLSWSNGDVTIPIAYEHWYSKDILEEEDYLTKIEIAQKLLEKYSQKINFQYLLIDELYCTVNMLNFLQNNHFKFEARMASNRKVKIGEAEAQLKKHAKLKLIRNQRCLTVKGTWHNISLFFTTDKRKNKHGEYKIVYQVSNFEVLAKKHVEMYKQRWKIEEMFRTIKQHLGFNHCQSRKLVCQDTHLWGVFYAYAFTQVEKYRLKTQNSEEVINMLSDAKLEEVHGRIDAFNQIFAYVA